MISLKGLNDGEVKIISGINVFNLQIQRVLQNRRMSRMNDDLLVPYAKMIFEFALI